MAALGLAAALLAHQSAMAEVREVQIATHYGFGFLPMMIIEHEHLFDKRLAEAGQKDVSVHWSTLGVGTAMNDALLSGSLDIASGGIAPFIVLWAKAKNTLEVRAISALDSMPLSFNTRNPDVHRLEFLSPPDAPAPKT